MSDPDIKIAGSPWHAMNCQRVSTDHHEGHALTKHRENPRSGRSLALLRSDIADRHITPLVVG
jgi:hypothetical protein